MKPITEIDEIKEIGLNILKKVHDFCVSNDIMYSLACGTLIGAVRHKGFIPWDDDIDIYMLRSDYNRFISLFQEQAPEHLAISSLINEPKWHLSWAKVYDIRTVCYEHIAVDVKETGLGIDIFPIDSAPESREEWRHFEKKRRIFVNACTLKKMKWSKKRSKSNNILMCLCKLILFPFSIHKLATFLDQYAQSYNDDILENYNVKPILNELLKYNKTLIDINFYSIGNDDDDYYDCC